jgi:hypothetical protein
MFRYDVAEALEHPVEEKGVQTIRFPKSLVIYLEPAANTPDYKQINARFPDGSRYNYQTPAIKLRELLERCLVIFTPLYLPKLRKRMKQAGTHEEGGRLAAELKSNMQGVMCSILCPNFLSQAPSVAPEIYFKKPYSQILSSVFRLIVLHYSEMF